MAKFDFRTKEQSAKYHDWLLKNSDVEPFLDKYERMVKEFNYWVLIKDPFPLDKIAKTHHLLIPKRKVATWLEVSPEELSEFQKIKQELYPVYDFMMENFESARTIKNYLHINFIILKDDE